MMTPVCSPALCCEKAAPPKGERPATRSPHWFPLPFAPDPVVPPFPVVPVPPVLAGPTPARPPVVPSVEWLRVPPRIRLVPMPLFPVPVPVVPLFPVPLIRVELVLPRVPLRR